ncbi:hypothetical protein EOE18_13195 [Novosphingobium umbonatum]|uniref:Uncharacterized protein n=1 Tax=Novosphingobium umbonatum TaxID=1908524 RepID=A0A437N2G2_9SPHN|nr:hypothetical protein [Novosphingobium umbonatum]RVU04120.1 hypothetical protein EOE18_13195 [Novosphingobium umbonatum]
MDPTEAIGQVLGLLKFTRTGPAPLFDALEAGSIAAQAECAPDPTGIDILDAAVSPTALWWNDYKAADSGGLCAPTGWAIWLNTHVLAPQADLIAIADSCLEVERLAFSKSQTKGRQNLSWSDLEAVAWIASRDPEFVLSVRAFAQQPSDARAAGRAAGLRYLRHHIAVRHCQCRAEKPLRPIGADGACSCLPTTWERLIIAIQAGLKGEALDGTASRTIRPEDLLFARFFNFGFEIHAALTLADEGIFFSADAVKLLTTNGDDQIPIAETRAPSVKLARPPANDAILKKADEMHKRGMKGRDIASRMRFENGFENTPTTLVRELIKGRYRSGRKGAC